ARAASPRPAPAHKPRPCLGERQDRRSARSACPLLLLRSQETDRPEEPLVKNLGFVLAATVTGACGSHATLSPGLTAPRSPGVDQTARPFSPVTSGPKGHHHSVASVLTGTRSPLVVSVWVRARLRRIGTGSRTWCVKSTVSGAGGWWRRSSR